jgi:hypothetical protein
MRAWGTPETEEVLAIFRNVTHGPGTIEPLYGSFAYRKLGMHGGQCGYVAGRK